MQLSSKALKLKFLHTFLSQNCVTEKLSIGVCFIHDQIYNLREQLRLVYFSPHLSSVLILSYFLGQAPTLLWYTQPAPRFYFLS